jgi:hypothetical protein
MKREFCWGKHFKSVCLKEKEELVGLVVRM